MYVCYEIYETIQVNEVTDRHDELIDILKEHVSRLAGYHLLSKAYIYNISLSAGPDKYTCSEGSTGEAWKAFINVLDAADDFTLSMGYTYEDNPVYNTDNIGIGRISDYLADRDDEYLNTVYYKTYSWASNSGNSGELSAYGMKAGRMHRGPLTYLSLYRIPDGKWFNQQAAFSFDLQIASREQIAELEPLCQQLMLLSSQDTLEVEGSKIYYSMNNAYLDGIEEVEEYIACVKAVLQIIDQDAFDTYFFDSSANNMKLLHITIYKNQDYKLEIAEL